MADLRGRNDSLILATDLGALAFENTTTAPNTDTEISFLDSVGAVNLISRFGAVPGPDPVDYFAFTPSGIGSVTISIDTESFGTYAGFVTLTPFSGVTKVEGDIYGGFYGGANASGNTQYAELIKSAIDESIVEIRGTLSRSDTDFSGITGSNNTVMTSTWTLDGQPVIFEVAGLQLNGTRAPSNATSITLSEIGYSLEVTPLSRMFSETGNGGLLFENIENLTQVHTGGDAIDTYVFNGSSDVFRIEFDTEASITVSNTIDRTNPDVLVNIERIQLNDGFLAFDTDGNAGQMYRLYQAAFDREPDVAGLGHWIDTFDRGLFDLKGVAEEFLISEEFQTRFGTEKTLDDKAYLTLLYNNVLDRTPDDAGFDFWSDQQAQGLSRADMLQYFSESEENYANVAAEIDMGIFYL